MAKEWNDKKESYEVPDGRGLAGNFLSTILEKSKKVSAGGGICVVRSFDPIRSIPLWKRSVSST